MVHEAEADADYLITSAALKLSETEKKPVVVVDTDTDLLVKLTSQAPVTAKIFIMTSQNPKTLFNINKLQI